MPGRSPVRCLRAWILALRAAYRRGAKAQVNSKDGKLRFHNALPGPSDGLNQMCMQRRSGPFSLRPSAVKLLTAALSGVHGLVLSLTPVGQAAVQALHGSMKDDGEYAQRAKPECCQVDSRGMRGAAEKQRGEH